MSRKILYVYIILVCLYLGLTFFIPAEARVLEKYDITRAQASLLNLTIVIPVIGIWFAAFYGYSKFKRYADAIHESKDGKALAYITNGLGLLALSLPVNSILSAAFRYPVSESPDLLPITTIITNYIGLLFTIAAFLLIYKGAQHLAKLVSEKQRQLSPYVLAAFSLFAVLYTFIALTNPYRQTVSGNVAKATYYLPDPMILLTIVIPYVFIWFIAIKALANIHAYKTETKGIVYRQTLSYLVRGIGVVIFVSILLQLLKDTSSILSKASLGGLMGIIYLLLLAMATGYILIAMGAKRLQKIEEV